MLFIYLFSRQTRTYFKEEMERTSMTLLTDHEHVRKPDFYLDSKNHAYFILIEKMVRFH